MTGARAQASIAIVGAVVVAAAVSWAGSRGGARLADAPVFFLCAVLAFAINWLAFVPAWLGRTEKYYDLTGSLTYLSVTGFALWAGGVRDARAWLLAGLVTAWALRLGAFLFARIRREGKDRRFDALKTDPLRFLMAWTLQGLWVLLTLACALAAITVGGEPLGAYAAAGTLTWLFGFAVEVAADRQKRAFRRDPANRGRFISSGLWAWSRHPNYFGEIVLWCGIALIALPTLEGWRWVTLVSPLFVWLLLTRISGVPPLEAHADATWGDDPEYRAYKARTPVLFPRPPRRAVA
jgi:steroid 5-alpha reductase family enzyme